MNTRRFHLGGLSMLLALLTHGPWLRAETAAAEASPAGMVLVPAGRFEMGDHHGFVDPKHGGDETPVHAVFVDAFHIGIHAVTTTQFCEFLDSVHATQEVEVRNGGVFVAGKDELLAETREMSEFSRLRWDTGRFTVLDHKENHPVVGIRWAGAALYCNWLGRQTGRPSCYEAATWDCDFNKSGFRLPTEAEWEYAARGGLRDPYGVFPWGDAPDPTRANWPESRNPFRAGPLPWTTPVGFFDGRLHRKEDFSWPGAADTFQTAEGVNGYGLADMSGNVWQFVNDWYSRDYYASSPATNPPGPARGSLMPDGKAYRGMRGGNWYNGENGHGRVANRNPSYFRGPQDPEHPYYHIGFRVVLPVDAERRAVVRPTAVAENQGRGNRREGGRGNDTARTRPEGGPWRMAGDPSGRDRLTEADGQFPRTPVVAPGSKPGGASLLLRSPVVEPGGELPVEFTGDGASATLPLEWSGAPSETRSFALIMHHEAPDQIKWYWTLYNIPADLHALPMNVKGIGKQGNNSVTHRAEYAPPQSKGPGAKKYIYTLYALSAPLEVGLSPDRVDRDALLSSMSGLILASSELRVTYTRQSAGTEAGNMAQEQSRERPRRAEAQDRGAGPGQGRNPERGGGREEMPENKTPTSPNPGQTVGLFLNTSKASAGYTLFAPKHNTVTYLMDNEGRVIRQWKSEYEPGQSAYLLPSGHLVRAGMLRVQGGTGGGEGGRIEEFDWDGNLVWEFNHASRDYQLHHDFKLLPNGHVLALMVERKSREQAVAAGFDPNLLRDDFLVPDAVVEIEPIYPKGGKIVWEWHVWDHLVQNTDPAKPNYGDPAAHLERVDVACNGRGTPAFWNHMNSIDYHPGLDQIVLSVRGCNEIWVIDHSTTIREAASQAGGRYGKGGDLLYRWGNPAAYGLGTSREKQLVQQHDAQWIPDGCAGAGHMTIFNNGYDRGWSSIEEIVPPTDANGRYVLETGRPYGPDQPVWHYEAKNRTEFFSSEISGAQRLPNGNTLICAGIVGHLFEITPAGEMVWQYVNPMVRGGILAQGELPGKDTRGHLWNAVFKAHRYPPDYPGLIGRDLTPKGVIELPADKKGKTGLNGMTEQQRPDRGGGGPSRGRGGGQGGEQGGGGRGDRPPRNEE